MKTVELLTIIALLLIASSNAILNGEVYPHKPYYARISFRSTIGTQENRAGVIIADRFILTSGSFFDNSEDIQVWVGSHIRAEQQSYQAVGMLRISTFTDGPAMIQLITPLQFNSNVQSIPFSLDVGLPNEQGLVLGMGGLTPATRDRVHAAFMRITSQQTCLVNYPDRNSTANAYFCAFDSTMRSDFCIEDRGTALTVLSQGREYLVGIAIEGVCNNVIHTRPSLFANISHFRNRISEILDGLQNLGV